MIPEVLANIVLSFSVQNPSTNIEFLIFYYYIGPHNHAQDNWMIRYASKYGFTEIVRLLLQDNRVDPTSYNNYSIGLASENGHLEIVRLLLQDNRVDPTSYNNYAIDMASENGHIKIVEMLQNHIKNQ